LNLGDTYFGAVGHSDWKTKDPKRKGSFYDSNDFKHKREPEGQWLQPKQKMLMPHRVAIALQDDGWILRNDIVWHKPNPMPTSVKDRLNTCFEFVFHFVRSKKYFYDLDAIREAHKEQSRERALRGSSGKDKQSAKNPGDIILTKHEIAIGRKGSYTDPLHKKAYNPAGKNPGDFWNIATHPFPEAHFATFPEELCKKPILSSCPKDGFVLDPFCGSGTALLVAQNFKRKFLGFELSPEYIKLAKKRLGLNHKLLNTFD